MPESAAARRALRTDARRQLMEQQFDFLGFTFGRMLFAENRPGTPGATAMLPPGPSQIIFGLRATLSWRKPDSNSSELVKPIDLRVAEELEVPAQQVAAAIHCLIAERPCPLLPVLEYWQMAPDFCHTGPRSAL